jgi:hypothetical protein
MVIADHVVKVASMLALPDLEPETKQAINLFIREALQPPAPQPHGTLNPFEAAASRVLGPDVLQEWLEGSKEGDK